MAVYDRACRSVDEAQRYELYLLYIKKAEEFFGVTKTREIYEKAIEELPDMQARYRFRNSQRCSIFLRQPSLLRSIASNLSDSGCLSCDQPTRRI